MFYDRVAQPSTMTKRVSKPEIFPAPSRGWIRNEALAKPKGGGAEVLDNWFPKPEGARMRKGSIKRATIDAAVTHIAVYDVPGAQKMFATDATSIYDVTSPASASVAVTADITGQTSGDWSSLQFTTSGGTFLLMVNGADNMQQYDGSAWLEVDDSSVPRSITGVATADISHLWKYGNRVFMVEQGTMDAWYLDALSVGGAAAVFPLGGVFNLGGSLLFGCSWSADAGDGLDDYCVFVTTEGELAVYQGGDPSTAETFQKVGVYRIGRPVHKNAHFRAGGDIGVITDDGIVPLSAAIQKDKAALIASAITYPIEEAWRLTIRQRNSGTLPFSCVIWPTETMLVVGIPSSGTQRKITYISNTRTGAWARYTGWDTRAVAVFQNKLYFGTSAGTIVEGEIGGADQGSTYSSVFIPKFADFGRPEEKAALHCRIVARGNHAFTPQLFANADYDIQIPTPIAADPDDNDNLWDTGIWGQSTWGVTEETKVRQSEWQSVAAVGQALAPGLQITSGRTAAPDVELIALHLVAETGDFMA
jgi:hypothetical protein